MLTGSEISCIFHPPKQIFEFDWILIFDFVSSFQQIFGGKLVDWVSIPKAHSCQIMSLWKSQGIFVFQIWYSFNDFVILS